MENDINLNANRKRRTKLILSRLYHEIWSSE